MSELTIARALESLQGPDMSIFGGIDILNTRETSIQTINGIDSLLSDTTGEKVYIGHRMLNDLNNPEPILMIYNFNPDEGDLPFELLATAVNGPLTRREAKAAAYILETGFRTEAILNDASSLGGNQALAKLLTEVQGKPRFLPLGLITLNDYIARMCHYRRIQPTLANLDLDEDDDADLEVIVGLGLVPLAKAFRLDGYRVGDNFQSTIEELYAGNPNLLIPFAGIDKQPATREDNTLVGIGLVTGTKLFRKIESSFQD